MRPRSRLRSLALRTTVLLSAFGLATCAPLRPAAPTAPPVAASPAAVGQAMVAAANPLAVDAGLEVLRQGGSAVDAAVAVQAVLGLVEPQSSGLGGGAFLLVYDPLTRVVTAYDGRETAPARADETLFLENGKPLSYAEAVVSGRATGVPGVVAMLGEAHRAHGRRPWPALFERAARLADDGFTVSPRLAGYIAADQFPQSKQPDVRRYFDKPDGTRLQAGDTLRNPAYAATLRRIAAEGPRALYEGPLAAAIVDRVDDGPRPGTLSLADLAGYQPRVAPALCRPYRVNLVCTAPPPSSGVALLQLLGMLETTDIADRGPADPQGWYLFAEASRLMYADRDRYVGDVPVPVQGLLDPDYVRRRAALIGPKAGPAPQAGTPAPGVVRAPDRTREAAGTSHFTIVDARGQVVSMTTTVESLFGTGRMAGGFFLNNQLTDFSFQPRDPGGALVANAPAGGKRPRSSMAPVIVLDRQGRFLAAVGSPGGNAILAYNGKALVGWLDWELSMQDAVALPNLIARGETYSAEAAKFAPGVVEGLQARGITLTAGRGENSGLHGIGIRDGRLEGGADPRREGVARAP